MSLSDRHPCQCSWDECPNFLKFYENNGISEQKGVFTLRFSKSEKNKEFRHLVCLYLGIQPKNKDRIFIANYHWNSDLLKY